MSPSRPSPYVINLPFSLRRQCQRTVHHISIQILIDKETVLSLSQQKFIIIFLLGALHVSLITLPRLLN